jgi:hypothetical protein
MVEQSNDTYDVRFLSVSDWYSGAYCTLLRLDGVLYSYKEGLDYLQKNIGFTRDQAIQYIRCLPLEKLED